MLKDMAYFRFGAAAMFGRLNLQGAMGFFGQITNGDRRHDVSSKRPHQNDITNVKLIANIGMREGASPFAP
jgi:hypothetical protein